MIKSTVRTDTTKQEFPDMTLEEIQALCDEQNEIARQEGLKKKEEDSK